MQLLLSEAALERIDLRLRGHRFDLDVVTMSSEGLFRREGVAVDGDEIDPEIFWVSRDLYPAGMLSLFMQRILQGACGEWAQLFTAGVDHPAFKALMAKGVRLSKSVAQAPAIADFVLCQALSRLHPLAAQRRAQAAKRWSVVPFREVASTRWLMVGLGAIGGEVARRLKPFGARLTVVRRSVAPHPLAADVRSSDELVSLLPEADVVVLACALNSKTRHIAGPAFFAAMKPGSLLINVARGGLVDEAALRAGLARGQPGHAVLDVFETEPLAEDAWFWDHPQVSLTAHGANDGDGVLARGDADFLDNLGRFLKGEPVLHEAQRSEVGL